MVCEKPPLSAKAASRGAVLARSPEAALSPQSVSAVSEMLWPAETTGQERAKVPQFLATPPMVLLVTIEFWRVAPQTPPPFRVSGSDAMLPLIVELSTT